jgi:hypothetical protein
MFPKLQQPCHSLLLPPSPSLRRLSSPSFFGADDCKTTVTQRRRVRFLLLSSTACYPGHDHLKWPRPNLPHKGFLSLLERLIVPIDHVLELLKAEGTVIRFALGVAETSSGHLRLSNEWIGSSLSILVFPQTNHQLNSWVDESFRRALALVPISCPEHRRDHPRAPPSAGRVVIPHLTRPQHASRWSHWNGSRSPLVTSYRRI